METPAIDPVAIVDSLSSAEIRKRLNDLAAQQAALRTLYRAAQAKERAGRHGLAGKEAGHA